MQDNNNYNNNNNNIDYNIEDTARLMTEAGSGMKRKRLILIIAAVVAVAVIAAVVGVRTISDRKYNDQIAIAEKALREGDYEQAEVEYLAAVDMNKRKVKAREGLAYTYALESKFEDSSKVYQELYDETKKEEYKEAAEETAIGNMPSGDDLAPGDNLWIAIDPGRIPDPEGLDTFLTGYLSSYALYSILSDRNTGSYYQNYGFDNENPEESYALPMAEDLLVSESYEEFAAGVDYLYENDPRGWLDDGLNCDRTQKEAKDRVFTEIFNVSEDKIDAAVAAMEEMELLYTEDGYYYEFVPPMGVPWITGEPTAAWINGSRYCIRYDAAENSYDETEEWPVGEFYAVMTRREVEGRQQWTMIYNGEDMPSYVEESLKKKEESGQPGGGAGGDYSVFGELKDITFVFSSGAGGWGTEVTVNADGSFEGHYSDYDLGITGDGYPTGSVSKCDFTGKFTAPQKVDEYTYEFKVESIEFAEEPGKEYIEDGYMVTATEAYGIGEGESVELYLPGKPASELADGFVDWMYGVTTSEDQYSPVMKIYGLCVNGSTGFAGLKDW